MKKRALSVVLFLCLMISLVPIGVSAAETDGTCGENAVWSYDAASRTLTISGSGEISDYWFDSPWETYAPVISRVVIEDGITAVGDNAFEDLLSLTEIIFADTLTVIGDSAFRGCLSLEQVSIPNGVTEIGDGAFEDCANLSHVELPDGLAKISGSMFRDCPRLEAVRIPAGVVLIGDYAFFGCESLSAVTLPDGVVTIGVSAFYGCESLVYVTIPASLVQVELSAFSSCDDLCHVLYRGTETRRERIIVDMGNTDLTDALWHCDVSGIPITVKEICTGTSWYCEICEKEIHQTIVSGESHSFGDWTLETAATCTEPGSRYRICQVCEYRETQVVSAAGHKFSLQLTAPSCTEDGSSVYICDVCGEERNAVTLPAYGHTFGLWVETKAPTTTEEGVQTRTCITCGAEETRPVDKLTEETEPTLPDDGEEPTQPSEPTEPAPDRENPFVDISENKYYYDPVLWAYDTGITTGKDATHFQPNAPCTRAQIVTFLWRAMGQPEPDLTINPFTDVTEGKYYYKAVLWAVQTGITTGKTFTTFEPDAPCTRAQVVTFLWRAMGRPVPQTRDNHFTDVPNTSYYRYAVLWAYENEITLGKTATTFQPNETCTRGQIVTFLYRTLVEN